jgi:hypothetical protein
MSMNYKAELSYVVIEGKEDKSTRDAVPVSFFQVDGGANRFLKIGASDDVNIAAELEEATTLKNIILYLPPTTDGRDMETALELTNVALDKKFSLYVSFNIEKHSSGRMIETFVLAGNGTLKQRPFIVGSQMLKVELRLSTAKWYRGKPDKKNIVRLEEM